MVTRLNQKRAVTHISPNNLVELKFNYQDSGSYPDCQISLSHEAAPQNSVRASPLGADWVDLKYY